jgi:hypothetical protein
MSDEELALFFIPSLSTVLLNRERAKGSPLTEEEVISIRDQAVVVALRPEIAKGIEEERGYRDINGENCWEERQILRRQLDQKDTA